MNDLIQCNTPECEDITGSVYKFSFTGTILNKVIPPSARIVCLGKQIYLLTVPIRIEGTTTVFIDFQERKPLNIIMQGIPDSLIFVTFNPQLIPILVTDAGENSPNTSIRVNLDNALKPKLFIGEKSTLSKILTPYTDTPTFQTVDTITPGKTSTEYIISSLTTITPSTIIETPRTYILFYGTTILFSVRVIKEFGQVIANSIPSNTSNTEYYPSNNEYLSTVKNAYDIQSDEGQYLTQRLYTSFVRAYINVNLLNQTPTIPDNMNLTLNDIHKERATYMLSSSHIQSENNRLMTAYDQSFKSSLNFKMSNESAEAIINQLRNYTGKSMTTTAVTCFLILIGITFAIIAFLYKDYAIGTGIILVSLGACLMIVAVLHLKIPLITS